MADSKVVSVNDWTRGRAVGFIPYSWFFKDETALLNAPKETLFFQNFGLDPEVLASYVVPKPREERWYSQDYDERWRWTTILMPSCVGHGRSAPLEWDAIKELQAKRKALA